MHTGGGWGKLAHLEARSRRLSTAALSGDERDEDRPDVSVAKRKPGHAFSAAAVHQLSLLEVSRAWKVYWHRAVWDFKRAGGSDADVVEKTHQDKYFESLEPGRVPHWVEKDTISTLMDLDEKIAYSSGIVADVTLSPNLEISPASASLELRGILLSREIGPEMGESGLGCMHVMHPSS